MIKSENEIGYEKPGIEEPEQEKKRGKRPRIQIGKCNRCLACMVFCPESVITITKSGNPSVSHEYCTGCLICLRVCPEQAIEEV